jgi:TolB protein
VTANADGTAEQLLLHLRTREAEGKELHEAQWSPDGRRIAVTVLNITARPRLGSAIYVLNADGSNLRRITPMRLIAGNPDWSPDGRRIVFNSSFEGQAAVELYTVRPDGKACGGCAGSASAASPSNRSGHPTGGASPSFTGPPGRLLTSGP